MTKTEIRIKILVLRSARHIVRRFIDLIAEVNDKPGLGILGPSQKTK